MSYFHYRSSEKKIYDVVIAGAGVAGLAAAHHLTSLGATNVLVIDPRRPGSLTSSKSTGKFIIFFNL